MTDETKQCRTCLYWDGDREKNRQVNGLCRIGPPDVNGWPKCKNNDWCGCWMPHIAEEDDECEYDPR